MFLINKNSLGTLVCNEFYNLYFFLLNFFGSDKSFNVTLGLFVKYTKNIFDLRNTLFVYPAQDVDFMCSF